MTLIKPIGYWEQKDVKASVPAVLPKISNIKMRFEDALTNVSGTIWTDTSGLGYTTGRIEGSPLPTVMSGGLYINGSSVTRTGRFRVTTNTNIAFQSLAIVFNMPYAQYGGTSTARNYFWDMRKSSGTTNGGYFNQYDSIDNSVGTIYYNGTYYSYDDATNTTLGPLALTPANLTNAGNNIYGGTGTNQWLGPSGRGTYTKRLWVFNFNTTRPLDLTTTAVRGLVFGTNDGLTEGSSLGISSIIGWDTALNSTDFSQLVSYYKGIGTL